MSQPHFPVCSLFKKNVTFQLLPGILNVPLKKKNHCIAFFDSMTPWCAKISETKLTKTQIKMATQR